MVVGISLISPFFWDSRKLLTRLILVFPEGRWKRLATNIIIKTLERSVNIMDEFLGGIFASYHIQG